MLFPFSSLSFHAVFDRTPFICSHSNVGFQQSCRQLIEIVGANPIIGEGRIQSDSRGGDPRDQNNGGGSFVAILKTMIFFVFHSSGGGQDP